VCSGAEPFLPEPVQFLLDRQYEGLWQRLVDREEQEHGNDAGPECDTDEMKYGALPACKPRRWHIFYLPASICTHAFP